MDHYWFKWVPEVSNESKYYMFLLNGVNGSKLGLECSKVSLDVSLGPKGFQMVLTDENGSHHTLTVFNGFCWFVMELCVS